MQHWDGCAFTPNWAMYLDVVHQATIHLNILPRDVSRTGRCQKANRRANLLGLAIALQGHGGLAFVFFGQAVYPAG